MKERFLELVKEGKTNEQILTIIKAENKGKVTLLKAADKLTLPQRARFVTENWRTIRNQATLPTVHTEWTGADQPVQYLKSIKDLHNWTLNPDTHKSHVSVDVDGTCSGIQVYAMLYRDKAAAHGVNVSPSETVQDIYGTVAAEMVKIIEGCLEDRTSHRKLYDFIQEHGREVFTELSKVFINRKHTKRIVMTLTYGLTNFGILGYSEEAIEALGEDNFKDAKKAKMAFAKVVSIALDKAAECAVIGMKFTQKISKYCAAKGIGLQWTSPVGFKAFRATEAVEDYQIEVFTKSRKQITCDDGTKNFVTAGASNILRDEKRTGELSASKQSNAVAPDVIHDLDAALLMRTVTKGHSKGITKFKLVHDSFGTTAKWIPTLNTSIREACVDIAQGNFMQEWAVEVTRSENWEECVEKVNEWAGEKVSRTKLDNAIKSKKPSEEKIATLQADYTSKLELEIAKKGISDDDIKQGDFVLEDVMKSKHVFS